MNASQMSRGTWYYTRDRLLGSFATACWDGTSEGPGAQTLTSHRWKKNNKNSSDEGRTKMRQAESTQQERGFWTRRHWCLDCLASTLPYCTAGSWRTWSFLSYCTRASWQTAASTPPVGWSSLHHCLLEKALNHCHKPIKELGGNRASDNSRFFHMTTMLDSYSQQKKHNQGMQAAMAYPWLIPSVVPWTMKIHHDSPTIGSQHTFDPHWISKPPCVPCVQHPRKINLLSKAGATWTPKKL